MKKILDCVKQNIHIIFCIFIVLNLAGCQLPPNKNAQFVALDPQFDQWLNLSPDAVQQNLATGKTAYLALDDALLSIASRLYLISQAKSHIDLQYYIWEDDFIGHLMLAELLKAADRGVKIRLLIDDQNGVALDQTLVALANHPNFEIRIFNPYKYRNFRVLDYILRFTHINHRMHNKLIIADGAIAVTGGRNISREYFDASDHFQFTDLDILFFGAASLEANQVFKKFWQDQLSYSVDTLIGKTQELQQLREKYNKVQDSDLKNRIEQTKLTLAAQLQNKHLQWAVAHVVADDPAKIRQLASNDQLIYQQMLKIMGQPREKMELVSAYFIPTQKGADYLANLSKNQTQVTILTNSFLANDVPIVHAFYQKYRKQLIKNGVHLYEFKPYLERQRRTWYEVLTGNVIPAKGKQASSLHAKFFDIDGKVFIGSFNFDPRSAHLNTEIGLVVESEQLQKEISSALTEYLPQIAYQLSLDHHQELVWSEHLPDGTMIHYDHDPHTTRFQRLMMHLVAWLPIEWMM